MNKFIMTNGFVGAFFALVQAISITAGGDSVYTVPAQPTSKDSITFNFYSAEACCCAEFVNPKVSVADTQVNLLFSVNPTPCQACLCAQPGAWHAFKSGPLKAGKYGIYRAQSIYCPPGTICPQIAILPVRVGSVTVSSPPSAIALSPDSNALLKRLRNGWELAYASGGFSGGTIYPSYKDKLLFDNALKYTEKRNDTLIASGAYRLQRNVQADAAFFKVYLHTNDSAGASWNNENGYYLDFPNDSTMVLDEGCCDLYAFYFRLNSNAITNRLTEQKTSSQSRVALKSVVDISGRKEIGNSGKVPHGIYIANGRKVLGAIADKRK